MILTRLLGYVCITFYRTQTHTKRWWRDHLEATMHHWADKELHWLWLDDESFEDKVEEEQDKANPNLNEAEGDGAAGK